MKLPDTLFGFLLKSLGAGGKIGVFIAKQLIRNFTRQQHAQVGVLVNILAHQIHSDGGADRGDVIGAQQRYHLGQRLQHIGFADDHLGVLGPEIFGHPLGVFQVDGIHIHADGKGTDGLFQQPCRHGAHQRGIQAAGKQKAHGCIGIQPLFNARHQLGANVGAGGFQIVMAHGAHLAYIAVAHKPAVLVIVARREGKDLGAKAHQVFGLAGKNIFAAFQLAVIQGPNANGVTGGDQLVLLGIIQDQRKLGVQHFKHIHAVLLIQRQQDLAVGFALEGIALGLQLGLLPAEAVKLAVAHHGVAVQGKGLHPAFRKPHNGQPMKAQKTVGHLGNAGHIRPAGDRAVKIRPHLTGGKGISAESNNCTHNFSPSQQ